MTAWRPIEIYGLFVRIAGEIEVAGPQRLSDVVNHVGDYLEVRDAICEPLASDHPILSRREPRMTVAKATASLVCPRGRAHDPAGSSALWRPKERLPAAITTQAFSMVADVHLEARHSLRDHLERYRGDFLPVTNLSALWVGASGTHTTSLQRPFGLLNSRHILAFATHPS